MAWQALLSGPAAACSLHEAQHGLELLNLVSRQRAQRCMEAVGMLFGQE
jgi:hypothetical protein